MKKTKTQLLSNRLRKGRKVWVIHEYHLKKATVLSCSFNTDKRISLWFEHKGKEIRASFFNALYEIATNPKGAKRLKKTLRGRLERELRFLKKRMAQKEKLMAQLDKSCWP